MEEKNKDSAATHLAPDQSRDEPDMFSLIPAGPEEAGLFFPSDSKQQEQACIGHLRGYYDAGGKRLYTSWFDHQGLLKTQEFREEFDLFMNGLRDRGILNTRPELERFCFRHPAAQIIGAWHKETYGFRAESAKHSYYLRLSLMPGDYAIYCYAYNCDILQVQGKTMPPKKRNDPER
jgi:hypothetical protein